MVTFRLIEINWKGMVLKGLLAILLVLVMALLPGPTLIAVTLLIGVFVLLLGIMAVVVFLMLRERRQGVFLLLQGLVGILFGIVAIVYPNITALILILILGVWWLLDGLFHLFAAVTAKADARLRGIVGVTGALGIVVGIILIVAPGDGAIALIWAIGLFAIAYGILNVLFGLMARSPFRSETKS
jgi:uncharacterized membrane protein HdeD (DUF308 family)